MTRLLGVTGVRTRASLDFVRHVFAVQASGRIAALLPETVTQSDLPAAEMTQIIAPEAEWGWFSPAAPQPLASEPAQISFTSGTTGAPRGIVLDGSAIDNTTARLVAAMGLDHTLRDYVGVPCTHSFGLARFRAAAAVGGKAYLPQHGFDAPEFIRMLGAGEVNALSAVPTLLRLLLDNADRIGEAGRKLRWMEIGSQPMSAVEKRAVRELFPAARIVQHYGLTEASRTSFLELSARDADLETVGTPAAPVEVGIGADGLIRIRGPHVARFQLGEAGLEPLLDSEGWLVTSDLGALHNGRLTFLGRSDDVINCGGIKLSPLVIEERLASALGTAKGYAIARTPDALRGDGILIAVEADSGVDRARIRDATIAIVEGMGVRAQDAVRVATLAELPRTGTGKIRRTSLAELSADAEAPRDPRPVGTMSPLRAAIAAEIGRDFVAEQDSIADLGVDSLNYIQVSLLLDQHLGHLPDGWESVPLARLEAGGRGEARTSTGIELATIIRAIAILFVVLDHAWTDAVYGAAVPLMVVAGHNFARFQMPKVLAKRIGGVIVPLLWRVVLPYFIAATIDMLDHRALSPLPYLLVSNIGGGVFDDTHNRIMVAYWFIEDYILFTILFSAGLSIAPIRSWMKDDGARASLILLGGFLALAFVALFHRDRPAFGEWTIFSVGWAFVLGWAMHQAETRLHRWLIVLAVLAIPLLTNDNILIRGALFDADLVPSPLAFLRVAAFYTIEMLPILAMLFATWVRLPDRIARGTSIVAGASLYIYIVHPFVLHVTGSDVEIGQALIGVAGSAVCGIVLTKAINLVATRVPRRETAAQF